MQHASQRLPTILVVVSLIISSHEIHICHARGSGNNIGRKNDKLSQFHFSHKTRNATKADDRAEESESLLTRSRCLISKLINLFAML